MGETTDQIRSRIDDQRHQLEGNLEGIEDKFKQTSEQVQEKVHNATDWRYQFNERPMVGIGIAFGAGALLAGMLGGGGSKDSNRQSQQSYGYQPQHQSHGGTDVGKQHMSNTMDNIKGALMSVAAAQAKSFLGQSVPSFDDEYRKVEDESKSGGSQRKTSGDTSQSASYPVHASERQELAGDR